MRAIQLIQIILIVLTVGIADAAQTAIHNITAYTSTKTGVREFSVLINAEDGRVAATGGSELLAKYPGAQRIDDRQVLRTWVGGERVFRRNYRGY